MMNILLTGSGGFLGSRIAASLGRRKDVRMYRLRCTRAHPFGTPDEFHFSPGETYDRLLSLTAPLALTHIIHVGAISSPAECEANPSAAYESHVTLTRSLATLARDLGAHLTFASSDLVFEGIQPQDKLLDESALPVPLSVYARTKLEGESVCLSTAETAVLRLCLIYGRPVLPHGRSVLSWMEGTLAQGSKLTLFADEFRTPIHVSDASDFIIEASERRLTGVWHCGGPERLSRVEFGQIVVESLGYDQNLIVPTLRSNVYSVPPRPEDVSLDSSKLFQAVRRAKGVKEALREEIS